MRFCVRDTGQGIAPEVLPKIFDPFFTTRPEGSGLGLAVVKKIATQHGADILVESTVGHGTCFELIWPVAVPPHQEWLEHMPGAAAGTCRRGDFNA
jgi:two-component system NtrC family sensor kinase